VKMSLKQKKLLKFSLWSLNFLALGIGAAFAYLIVIDAYHYREVPDKIVNEVCINGMRTREAMCHCFNIHGRVSPCEKYGNTEHDPAELFTQDLDFDY